METLASLEVQEEIKRENQSRIEIVCWGFGEWEGGEGIN